MLNLASILFIISKVLTKNCVVDNFFKYEHSFTAMSMESGKGEILTNKILKSKRQWRGTRVQHDKNTRTSSCISFTEITFNSKLLSSGGNLMKPLSQSMQRKKTTSKLDDKKLYSLYTFYIFEIPYKKNSPFSWLTQW